MGATTGRKLRHGAKRATQVWNEPRRGVVETRWGRKRFS
jgi:hypothetical protein